MKNKIHILGMGPGSSDYYTAKSIGIIKDSDLIIGSARIIGSLDTAGKSVFIYDGDFEALSRCVNDNSDKKIAVCVSGDTGFYSLAGVIERHFPGQSVFVPGISSFSYFFAAMGMTYEDYYMASVHGRETDICGSLLTYKKIFLLLDGFRGLESAVSILKEREEFSGVNLHIGYNLSYPDEKLISIPLKEFNPYGLEVKGSYVMAVEL